MTYITITIILCIAFAFAIAAPAAAVEMGSWRVVKMDDASKPQWRFVGAEWSGDDAGVDVRVGFAECAGGRTQDIMWWPTDWPKQVTLRILHVSSR